MSLKVEILGSGCQKCHQVEGKTKAAIAARNLEADMVHITDPMEIVQRGVMKTPALVVDGKVLSQGKVLEPKEIEFLLPA